MGWKTLAELRQNKSVFPSFCLSLCSALRESAARTDLLICKETRPQLSGPPRSLSLKSDMAPVSCLFSPAYINIFFSPFPFPFVRTSIISTVCPAATEKQAELEDEGLH